LCRGDPDETNDRCAALIAEVTAMTEFAFDYLRDDQLIAAGGSLSIPFGPPTPGLIQVFLEAHGLLFAAPHLSNQTTSAARPGFGPDAGLHPVIAHMQVNPFTSGRVGALGVFDPGGFDPPPPPPPVSVNVFRLELVDAGGTVRATQMGPMTFELPPPPAPVVDIHSVIFGLPASKWRLRITNTGTVNARLTTQMIFRGRRPIVSKAIDLAFINEKVDLLFNVPQPIRIAFENRSVVVSPGTGTGNGSGPISEDHTFVVIDVDEAWRELYPLLATEHDLGALVLPEVTSSYNITVKATVHDGALAFRARVQFPSFVGRFDGIEAIRALGHGTIATLVDVFTDAEFKIRTFALDLFLVLRPQGIFLQPSPTFEVIARPLLELEPKAYEPIVDALMQVAFERLLPEKANADLRVAASRLLGWLLGDRDRMVTGSAETLALQYAGDAPRPLTRAIDSGVIADIINGPFEPGNLSKIDHIVVVMMENRSFDHMLGFLSLPTSGNDGRVGLGRTDIAGLRGDESNPRDLLGGRQRVFSLATPWGNERPSPEHETRGTKFHFSPGHSFKATAAQRGNYNVELPRPWPLPILEVDVRDNEGFVLDFVRSITGSVTEAEDRLLRGDVMGYHPAEHMPMYRFLAEQYTVCDHWFASHPGPTLPNRFVTLTGQLARDGNGVPQVENPKLSTFDPLEIPTIFEHLDAAGIDWRYYEKDFGILRFFSKYSFDTQHVEDIDDPTAGFFTLAKSGRLPSVVFIDPDFADLPPGNDDQPPSDVTAGQEFIRKIYDALANGPREQWLKTMLIVVYDEHGGFFDHVVPRSKALFDVDAPERGGFVPLGLDPRTHAPIDHYGFRVPAFVVSPWVPARSVSSTEFDHTSILKTIIARFLPEHPPDMGLRVALAKDVGPLLSLTTPRINQQNPAGVRYVATGRDAMTSRRGRPAEDDDLRELLAGMRTRIRVRD
jgi:phospholipase C